MNKIKIQIGIYALSMLAMASLVVSPIIGLITQAFPGSSVSSVQMIISIPVVLVEMGQLKYIKSLAGLHF